MFSFCKAGGAHLKNENSTCSWFIWYVRKVLLCMFWNLLQPNHSPKKQIQPRATSPNPQKYPNDSRRKNCQEIQRKLGLSPKGFFPTLAVGLLDFKVDVVLARLEADFRDQPPSIFAVPNHQVSLQCPTTKYPCSAQQPSIPASWAV